MQLGKDKTRMINYDHLKVTEKQLKSQVSKNDLIHREQVSIICREYPIILLGENNHPFLLNIWWIHLLCHNHERLLDSS